MTLLSPCPKLQFFDDNGDPLSGGKVFTYSAGTTTPLATYTDSTGNTANANPVILNARGEASIWLTSVLGYKFILKSSTDQLIYTVDNINGSTTADQFAMAASVTYTPPGVGAVPTNVQAKLRQTINVKDYGATGDGVTDDSDAIETAILAAYNAAVLDGTMRRGAALSFPRGQYRIAQPSKLFSSLPSVAGGAGSFHFFGEGLNDSYASNIGASVLVFDPPTGATTEYLINNDNKIAWTRFENLGFVSSNGGTFWYGPTGAGVQSFEFRSCGFRGFTDIFNVGGATNNSEWSFFQCKFSNFAGRAFYLNNAQALNWRFFGCDAEVFSGTLLEFAKGSNIVWYSGSIIPSNVAARIIKVPSGATGIGVNNVPSIIFDSVRFETQAGALIVEKIQPEFPFECVFRDCGMGGTNIPTTPSIPKVLYWRGAGRVTFERCRNMGNYLWDYSTSGGASLAIAQLYVNMDNCELSNNYLTDSTFVLSDTPANTTRLPLFTVTGCGEIYDGVYRPASTSRLGVVSTAHSISFSAEGNQIQLVAVGAGWPQIANLYLPPVFLQKVSFFPANTTAFGAATATITIKDKAGTTLWTATYTMNAVPVPSETLISKKLTETDEYLQFEFSSSYVGAAAVPFVGTLMLTY